MVDKSELAIATSQTQNPIPFLIELLFNLLSQMITISTIKLTCHSVRFYRINLFNLLAQILIIIHVSFCTTCRKCGMWVKKGMGF